MSEIMYWAEMLLAVVGAASALAAALRPVIVALRGLALRTASKADDGFVEALSIGVEALALGMTYAHRALSLVGLNPKRRDV